MRLRFLPVGFLLVSCGLAGCASEGAGSAESRPMLPAALGARWTPPAFGTRSVDGERAAVQDACVAAANSLGFSVNRIDGALGRISAARRQTNGFDGSRQDTLEISVAQLAPGVVQVAAVFREVVEAGSGDGRSGGAVTAGLVRDRAPYDAFFARLTATLRPAAEVAP